MVRSDVRDGRDLEEWQSGIPVLDEGSCFDSDEKKPGWLEVLR